MSRIFNEKILELLDKGYAKSTSVMVGMVTKEQDGQVKRLIGLYGERKVSAGLHLEFDVKQPVYPQVESQYEKFISIFGIPPSHIDYHRPRGTPEAQFKELVAAGDRFAKVHDLPARNRAVAMTAKHTTYPAFMCKDITMDFDEVLGFLKSMKDGNSCELITHPGEYDPDCASSRNSQRKIDYDAIVRLQDFLEKRKDIANISYLEL